MTRSTNINYMKKTLLILSFALLTFITYSQPTYYWIGGNGTASNVSFTSASKWNTALDGSGTTRATSTATDVLIVDGTNVGGTTPTTGAVVATVGSTNFGQLILRNNAALTLVRPSTGTGTITVNGDGTSADDLLVDAGCTLTVGVADSVVTTSGNNLLLSATATGKISGSLNLSRGACRVTASNPAAGGSLFFESGSVCRTNTQITYYPFGSSSGVPKAVVFNSGSKLIYVEGNCPFTTSSTYYPVVFQPGSSFRVETSIPSTTFAVTSSNLFSTRIFSNVEIGANANVTGDFFYNIDNLTIEQGSSFYLKSSGASPISGNIINNGTFGSVAGFTSSNLLMKGITPQSVGGTGVFAPLGALSVATDADVTIAADLVVNSTSNSLINGKINFQDKTLLGTGILQTKAQLPVTTAVTTAVAGTNTIALDPTAYFTGINTAGAYYGILVSGTGVPANTYIIGTSSSTSTITISNPLTATPTSVTLSGNIPVVRTSNVSGIDGSLGTDAARISFTTATDFVFDGATTNPFSTVSLGSMRNVTFNASATTNRTALIDSVLTVNNGILSIRASDTIRIKNGKDIGGAPFSSNKYIATLSDASNSGKLRMDVVTAEKLFPIGSASYYMPATVTPSSTSVLLASVYEGITQNGSVSGVPFTTAELSNVVKTMWKIDRTSGSGDMTLKLGWNTALEGSSFATQPNANIGIIQNTGTSWSTPFGAADNTANVAEGTITGSASFGMGSASAASPFTFNPIAARTYGDADFSAGVSSLNTTQPINYSSADLAVATISSAGIIHIVGAGTTNIRATQASDGTYPAADVTQPLVVNKATLTITADNLSRPQGQANPVLTATYTGFVLGETSAVLLTPATLSTTAVLASAPGPYPITVSGATAANYTISFVDGILTVTSTSTQPTYYWIGGNGTASNVSFTSASKWNTALDGTGTTRATSTATDVLIVDGTNVGGTTPTTGAVVATVGSTNFGQLILRNNAALTLVRPSTGTGTITVNGDGTSADDLLVDAGCTLTVGVADSVVTTSGNNLLLSATATGKISGSLNLSRGACRVTASNPAAGGSLFFESGSVCRTNTQITYYPFGSSSGVPKAVVFNSGSKLIYVEGNCPFTTSSTYYPVVFQPGSSFRVETSIPSTTFAVTSSNLFSTRIFSNVEIGANANVTGDFFYNIDNLTIEQGSSFYLKSSGASPISGNIINNGTFGSVAGFTSSNLLMKGITPQSVGGTGVFAPLGALSVATDADVTIAADLVVNSTSNSLINGKINFQDKTLLGTGILQTKAQLPVTTAVTTAVAGTNTIALDPTAYFTGINTAGAYYGILVSGTGVPANTYIIGTSSSTSTITISNPLTATPTSVTLSGNIPVVRTSNVSGIDGSLGTDAARISFTTATDFVFDGATTNPFSTVSLGSMRNVTFNASATTNRTALIDSVLTVNNGILSIRASDTIRIKNGKDIGGAPFSSNKYIATLSDASNSGKLRMDVVTAEKLFPIGSASYYMPATVTPSSTSVLLASVYEGITQNGSVSGVPFTTAELSNVVKTMWKIDRTSGSGDMTLKLGWNTALEGSSFATQPNANIGIIQNTGTSWSTPFGAADNTANVAEGTITGSASFGMGSASAASPFTFNPIAARTYGDADFSAGVSSLNTTQPINYSSADLAVATISSAGIIHIVGAGTTNIRATQASDGTYPAADVTQPFVVNKASLTIGVQDTTKPEGTPNPEFILTYAGFVLGETAAVLSQPATVVTDATQNASPGIYILQPAGATANNYDISYTVGKLTIVLADSSLQTMTVYSSSPGVINVRIYSPEPDLANIVIYDMQGRLITRKAILAIKGISTAEVNIAFAPNTYYVVSYIGMKNRLSKLLLTGK